MPSYTAPVRETRYNSQGYPLVTATLQDEDRVIVLAVGEIGHHGVLLGPRHLAEDQAHAERARAQARRT